MVPIGSCDTLVLTVVKRFSATAATRVTVATKPIRFAPSQNVNDQRVGYTLTGMFCRLLPEVSKNIFDFALANVI